MTKSELLVRADALEWVNTLAWSPTHALEVAAAKAKELRASASEIAEVYVQADLDAAEARATRLASRLCVDAPAPTTEQEPVACEDCGFVRYDHTDADAPERGVESRVSAGESPSAVGVTPDLDALVARLLFRGQIPVDKLREDAAQAITDLRAQLANAVGHASLSEVLFQDANDEAADKARTILMLLAAGAKVRNLGDVRWLATEDGSSGKGTGRHIACFVLEPNEGSNVELTGGPQLHRGTSG